MTAIEKYIQVLEDELTGSPTDIIIKAIIDKALEFLPIEKQDLQRAFESGKESKMGYIHENFGSPYVEYEYTETFDQFYSQLKGE